ncbi:hypothetical protein H0A36_20570 [Endozoicomonas sp. SM1973]|uniref:Uncharacterized protein n=1 Tax=Spartinivicinus marinus TaxID=2994442 RepID=A0A853IEE0_9GAMM|nr:hypothetical protein [Spartinivicinus marinus]MCX4028215.1 hypothetical protein [Spartinivicinus marinus]NYZ68414.1 hypothetical protein [Spartinivicinus marinus]
MNYITDPSYLSLHENYSNEKKTTQELQENTYLNSFAWKFISDAENKGIKIKKIIDNKIKEGGFKDFSGIDEPNNLLKNFFYIARYADINKNDFTQKEKISKNSPLYYKELKKATYDEKPWNLDWRQIPDYIKKHIYINREKIFTRPFNSEFKINSVNFNSDENNFIHDTGKIYDRLESSTDPKKDGTRFKFISKCAKCNRLQSNPIIQYQDDNHPYMEGYLMNVLDNKDTHAKKYYKTAYDSKLGLLSGPSGTSHRVKNLITSLYKNHDQNLDLIITSICLACLGIPYNCHSFYEIVTVIMPDNKDFHNIDKFNLSYKKIDWNIKYAT